MSIIKNTKTEWGKHVYVPGEGIVNYLLNKYKTQTIQKDTLECLKNPKYKQSQKEKENES